MPRDVKRILILVGAILLALLPLLELVDHWESFGSDPEFVSVCTVLGFALALCLLVRAAILKVVGLFRTVLLLPSLFIESLHFSVGAVQAVFPRIRAPIRI